MARRQGPPPPPYQGPTPQKAQAFGIQAAAAARTAAAFWQGWRSNRNRPDPLAVEQQRQLAKHAAALGVYRTRIARLRTRVTAGTAAAVGGVVVGASTLGTLPEDAVLTAAGGAAVAVGAWQAIKARRAMEALDQPVPPSQILPPPQPLPPGTAGAEVADRVTGYRRTIVEMLPAIEDLHQRAADEIRAADAATAPGMNAMVDRIRYLQQIVHQMPGTPAAHTAQLSINAMLIRLNEGATAYHDLLEAVIGLAGSPSLSGGPAATLRPAIQDMQAYAAGLQRASDAWLES